MGMFDDLIPQAGTAAPNGDHLGLHGVVRPGKSSGMFDDLLPQPAPQIDFNRPDDQVRADIAKLPDGQRQEALKGWADAYVAREREAGGTMQRVGDAVNRFARSVPGVGTWADELNARTAQLTGQSSYDEALAYNRARDRAIDATPTQTIATLPVIGDVTTGGLEKAAGTVAGAFALPMATVMRGAGAIPGAVNAATTGAVTGSVEGFGAGETPEDSAEKATSQGAAGLAFGAGLGAIAGKLANGPSWASPRIDRVATEDLQKAASKAYGDADKAGVVFAPQAVQRLKASVETDLTQIGYHPQLQPKIAPLLGELERLKDQNVTLKGVDTLRKMAVNTARDGSPSERKMAGQIIQHIDDAIGQKFAPGDIVMGDQTAGARAMTDARETWKRLAKTQEIERAQQTASIRTEATGSGGNINNATRQEIAKLLRNQKQARAFSDIEKDLIRSVVDQGPVSDILRLAGKVSPEGNGLTLMMHLAAAPFTGLPQLGIAALGMAAKRMADNRTLRSADNLLAVVSNPQGVKQLSDWRAALAKYKAGSMTDRTFMLATNQFARNIATLTGEDADALSNALLGGI